MNTDTVPGVKATGAIIGSFLFVIVAAASCQPSSTTSSPKPEPSAPAIDYSKTTYQGQLMADYQVGKVLAEIKCGKRPTRDGIDLLNVNGVPPALLENHTPEMKAGFDSVWC